MKIFVVAVALVSLGFGVNHACATSLEETRARWNDPQVVERIDAGIERNRKGDVVVEVVDEAGQAIPGATVSAEQIEHSFLFGANLFVLGPLKTAELNQRFEEAFTGLFNFASLPFYWKDLEPAQGALRFTADAPYIWRRPPPDVLLAWCKTHGITPKGHPLVWHSINPDWMPKEPEALRAAYVKRFNEIAERYADEIPIWDVVNESLVCHENYPLYSPEREYVPWAFEQAHSVFSEQNLLMINEVMTVSHEPLARNRYYRQVESLLSQGCGIEGIGFQFHYFSRDVFDKSLLGNPSMGPLELLDLYDGFGKFGRPLYITEITIPGSGPDGAAVQAEFASNLYRLWFSVKEMAGITWWNLPDNAAYGNENAALGGLLDENMNPKPAYAALDRLINREWTTHFEGVTDEKGRCTFRGFGGVYEIRALTPSEKTYHTTESVESGHTNRWMVTQPGD